MKINGIERGGYAEAADGMELRLLDVDTDGLTVGTAVVVEDGNNLYDGRVIVSIGVSSVLCDGAEKRSQEIDRADIDYCLMMLEG